MHDIPKRNSRAFFCALFLFGERAFFVSKSKGEDLWPEQKRVLKKRRQ